MLLIQLNKMFFINCDKSYYQCVHTRSVCRNYRLDIILMSAINIAQANNIIQE